MAGNADIGDRYSGGSVPDFHRSSLLTGILHKPGT
jgi:hypothetical protein